MQNKKQLEELHQQSLEKVDELLKSKGGLKDEHKEKISNAKKEWQLA